MIMEIHSYKIPSMHIVLKQTWARVKSIIYLVFPFYIIGGTILSIMKVVGMLDVMDEILEPVTVQWLGLPAVVGSLLVFGVVRKELVIVMPAIIFNTTNLSAIFTDVQMIVLAFVTMLYIPCIATIMALKKEFGSRVALYISLFELIFAILLGGILFRLLTLLAI